MKKKGNDQDQYFDECDDLIKETNQLRSDIMKFQKKINNQRGSFKHKIL